MNIRNFTSEVPAPVAYAAVLVIAVLLVLLGTFLAGGWKAEPNVSSFCDASSLVDGAGNRVYVSTTGAISVTAADKTC